MKKKFVIAAICLGLTFGGIPAAAESTDTDVSYTQEQFQEMTFQIPSSWTLREEKESACWYEGEEGELFVTYSYLMYFDLMPEEMQKEEVNSRYNREYTKYSGYKEVEHREEAVNGAITAYDVFTKEVSGVEYTCRAVSTVLGEGVATIMLTTESAAENTADFDAMFEKITEPILSGTESPYAEYRLEEGVYQAGTDLEAGKYIVFPCTSLAGYEVFSDSECTDILSADAFETNSILQMREGEYLKLNQPCYVVPASENPEVDTSGPGVFEVGIHIPAGEYRLIAFESENTVRLQRNPDTGEEEMIEANNEGEYRIYPDAYFINATEGRFVGEGTVSVSEGQILKLYECYFAEQPPKPENGYTADAVSADTSSEAPSEYADSDTVKRVQEALNAAGYDCGVPDGINGSGTAAAVRNYQSDKGLEVTGTINDELLTALGL